MNRSLILAVFVVATSGCQTVHIDIQSAKPAIAQRLHLSADQIMYARHVNWTLVTHYAGRPLERGLLQADFGSAIYVQTQSALYVLPPKLDADAAPLVTLDLSKISGVAIQSTTTWLTREHMEQLQIVSGKDMLALICDDRFDQIGGGKAETEATYQHLLNAGLHAGAANPYVIRKIHARVPVGI